MFQTRSRRPLSLLDRSVVISIAAMAAMNLLVIAQHYQTAPVLAVSPSAANYAAAPVTDIA